MKDTLFGEAEDAIPVDEISDESLEATAALAILVGRSIGFFCTGLSECPSPGPA
jgi:hypothetical protein